jgi:hypothetical protein
MSIALRANPTGTGGFIQVNGTDVVTIDSTGITSGVPVTPIASTAEAQAGTNNTNAITPLRLREGFNASGTAPVYASRAWVNFNGTGTVAIRASGNVTSITDNGTGRYTVNFTTAMPDANYAFCGAGRDGQGPVIALAVGATPTTTSVSLVTVVPGQNFFDTDYVLVTIFR